MKVDTIYCPICGRKAFTHDKRGTLTVTNSCRKCKVLIQFNPITTEVKTMKKPPRTSISGMRFW